jgi:hypothetical protein
MTLNELTYDLLERVRAELSDDEYIDKRQLKFWIHNQRALWLRNELNRNRTIDPNIIQNLGCVELELADASSCPGIPVGCSVLRSKQDIPNTVELHNKTLITRVGPLDKTIPDFSFVPYKQAIFSGNGRYSKMHIYAFLLHNRMYLKFDEECNIAAKMLTHINIQGVFEDPTEVSTFNDPDGQPCYSDDTEYPMNRWMYNYIKDAILKADLSHMIMLPTDSTNNANIELSGVQDGQRKN